MKQYTYKLTQEQFDRKLAELCEAVGSGYTAINGCGGKVRYRGVDAHFSYDRATQAVAVTVDHKPVLLSWRTVESKLNEWFAQD